VSAPLLLECELNGHVVWMSERTKAALGDTANVAETLLTEPTLAHTTICFRRVWATSDRVLLSGELLDGGGPRGAELLAVQNDLLRHFFELQRAERELHARMARLRRGGRSSAIRQVELERQRVGRELHTGVGQLLAAIRMQLEVIASQLPDPPVPVLQALGRISTMAADALDQVRSISKRLHPPEWQRLTLEAALRQLWENSGIADRFDGAADIQPLPSEPELEIKTLMYRAAQEALSNLMRHARASSISLSLRPQDGAVELTIRDNGVGFDVGTLFAAPASLSSGIGLRSIRDQAADVGGNFGIESGPNGTTLVIKAPYTPSGTPA
jgi:two-component system, NarL family, sensor kinase